MIAALKALPSPDPLVHQPGHPPIPSCPVRGPRLATRVASLPSGLEPPSGPWIVQRLKLPSSEYLQSNPVNQHSRDQEASRAHSVQWWHPRETKRCSGALSSVFGGSQHDILNPPSRSYKEWYQRCRMSTF